MSTYFSHPLAVINVKCAETKFFKYCTVPGQEKSRTLIFCWTAVSFDYGVHTSSWYCFDSLIQSQNAFPSRAAFIFGWDLVLIMDSSHYLTIWEEPHHFRILQNISSQLMVYSSVKLKPSFTIYTWSILELWSWHGCFETKSYALHWFLCVLFLHLKCHLYHLFWCYFIIYYIKLI